MPTHRSAPRLACATALALAASASTALGAAWLPTEPVAAGTYPEDYWLEVGRPLLAADGTAYLTLSESFTYGPDVPVVSRHPARGTWTNVAAPPTAGLGGVMRYPFGGETGAALDGQGQLHVTMPAGARTATGVEYAVAAATLASGGTWVAEGSPACGSASLSTACLDRGVGNPSIPDGLTGTPLALLPDGRGVTAWAWTTAGANRVRAALRSASGAWTASTDLATSATTPFGGVATAITSAGDAAVAWVADPTGSAPTTQVRAQKGGVWAPVRTLGASGGAPAVAAGDGYMAVAWRTPQGRLAIARRNTAGTWQVLGSVAAADEYPRPWIGVSTGGAVLVVWQSGTTVRSAYLAAGSTTPKIETVATAATLWDVTRPANGRAAVALERSGVVAVVRAGASGGWTAPMTVDARRFDATSFIRIGSDAAGNLLLAWWHANGSHAVPPFTNDQSAWSAIYDVTPPTLGAVSVPTRGTVNRAVAVAATASDALSAPGPVRWSFGDGGTAAGATAAHVYTRAGTFTVTARVADGAANETVVTRKVTVSR